MRCGKRTFAVRVGILEGLDKTQGLVDGAADGEVVDGDLAKDALRVDDEQAAARVGTATAGQADMRKNTGRGGRCRGGSQGTRTEARRPRPREARRSRARSAWWCRR